MYIHTSTYLGDLNVNFVNPSHPLYSKLCNIMSTYCLTQIVTECTHVHHNDSTSIIDLVILSNPASLLSCVTVPPLSNSDHNGLLTTMKWKGTGSGVHSSRRPIWRYAYADWEKACELIDNTNWDSLRSDDINLSWSNWQQQFMGIIEDCIPKGVLPPRKNLLWLNKNLICAMRKRNQLYKKAKQSGDFSKYKFARNRVVSKLHMAKRAYFSNLNPKNPKKVWKAVKYLNKSQCSIPTLSHGDATVQTDIEKANLLNSFFPPATTCHTHPWFHPNITTCNCLKNAQRSFCVMKKKYIGFCPPWMSQKPMAQMRFLLEC